LGIYWTNITPINCAPTWYYKTTWSSPPKNCAKNASAIEIIPNVKVSTLAMKTDFLEEISCPLHLYIGLIKSSNVTAAKEFRAAEIVLRPALKIPRNICRKSKISSRLNKYPARLRFKIVLNYKYKKLLGPWISSRCFFHKIKALFKI